MFLSFRSIASLTALLITTTLVASPSRATGHIDASTVISVPHGTFNGVAYQQYEAMFEGVTSNGRPYRVPCQIVTPQNPQAGRRLLLFDWLVPSTITTAVGQEQADARYVLTDNFLFGRGISYATVRCDTAGLGKRSSISNPSRPWSDGRLDTSSEFITSAGDEFDIVADYVKALRTDPIALQRLGKINRTAAFGYSASGYKLRGLLRLKIGKGLFDFSLVGGTGNGYDHPAGNKIGFSTSEKAPLAGAGLELDFQSEFDVIALGAHKTRHEEPNYRAYQFAGATHIRNIDVVEFGLPDPETANPAEWTPFIRALFVAGDKWCDGIQPPSSLWLGAPNDPTIVRDAKGNALVRYVGGQPVNTTAYRLPEVAVGENQYIPLDASYDDGSLFGFFRMSAGGHVDLTASFTNHARYVREVMFHARGLEACGYLLESDADAIIQRANQSDIGH
ncbi:alpha/beta hydrolase domain-containing protein [Armatimonas sp.]|uniref:alpha/beta hydrolase domain-containing protein n=1 Tax=Armatimonas sp. TaxID=1872638 RepID=UPI00374CD776